MTNYKIPIDEFKQYQSEHIGFGKGLIWYYEKETRLLVKLKGKAREKWEKTIQKNPEKKVRIVLSFNDSFYNRIKVTLAPNIDSGEMGSILEKYDGIHELFKRNSVVKLSQYEGTIKLNLCDRCDLKSNENKEIIYV